MRVGYPPRPKRSTHRALVSQSARYLVSRIRRYASVGPCSSSSACRNIPISMGWPLCFPRRLAERVASRSPIVVVRGSAFTVAAFFPLCRVRGGPRLAALSRCLVHFATSVSEVDASSSSSLTAFSRINRFLRAVMAPAVSEAISENNSNTSGHHRTSPVLSSHSSGRR